MAFELRALIGRRRVLEPIAAELPGARLVDLTDSLVLLPLAAAVEDALSPADRAPAVDGVRLGAKVARLAKDASKAGPILYAEADYSPGRDFQAAVLFNGGKMSGPPRADRAPWDPREPAMVERPVNAALRSLGVERGDYDDEWDAVALARHPSTEAWAA
ncbi:MAG: hypothetical protein HY553_10610 [Elusimicrobia bacterium]|nr:hypothetical protein [Elusimicrobiota bacterium]